MKGRLELPLQMLPHSMFEKPFRAEADSDSNSDSNSGELCETLVQHGRPRGRDLVGVTRFL